MHPWEVLYYWSSLVLDQNVIWSYQSWERTHEKEVQRHWVPTCSDSNLSEDMKGTNDASSADRRLTLTLRKSVQMTSSMESVSKNHRRTDDLTVLARVPMVWSSAEKRSERGSSVSTGGGGLQIARG